MKQHVADSMFSMYISIVHEAKASSQDGPKLVP